MYGLQLRIWPDTRDVLLISKIKRKTWSDATKKWCNRKNILTFIFPVSELCFRVYSGHPFRYEDQHTTTLSLKYLLILKCCHAKHYMSFSGMLSFDGIHLINVNNAFNKHNSHLIWSFPIRWLGRSSLRIRGGSFSWLQEESTDFSKYFHALIISQEKLMASVLVSMDIQN